MICTQCGNQIVVGCGPVCLVCQETGRGERRTATEIMMARNHAAALDAVYRAMDQGVIQTEEQIAADNVKEAQESLAIRISDQQHSREKPDWRLIDEESDRQEREHEPVCQSCLGTGRYLTGPCPDCRDEED